MSDDIERIAQAWYARFHAKDWDDQSAASRQFMMHATEELVASARDALGLTASDLAGLAEGTHVVVPVEPTLEMWRGLARDLMMWQEMGRPTGKNLYAHLKALGKKPPDWLRREIKDIDWVPSKGDRVVVIYRAMLEAARDGAKEPDHADD